MAQDRPGDDDTSSEISGGTFYGPVIQGRDFRDVRFDMTVSAPKVPRALAQLPPVVSGFAGRENELAVLTGLLDPAEVPGAVVVSAVAGLAGVGKTSLAVQAGHAARERGWYRGGILFIDLHGYDATPVQPGQALDALLRALGIPAEHIPPSTEERAGLYRSALAEIRQPVLVIADNVSSEAQVEPLLPGPGQHRVIITSRHTLAGLGARLLDVMVLGEDASVALLDAALQAARPGDVRISSDPESARRLAGICGGLPLALQIAAAMLNSDPAFGVGELAGELATKQDRLAALRYEDGGVTGGRSVEAAFDLSFARLDTTSALVFRLLALNPGPDLSTAAAGVMADVTVGEARGMLRGLARAHLIEAVPGAVGRWRMHDLVRLYAQQLSDAHADADRREMARDRLLSYYLNTVSAADDHLWALPGIAVPPVFTARADALAWLDAERPCLVAAVSMAAETRLDHFAMNLPFALARYLDWRRRFDDKLALTAISMDAARRVGDRHGEAAALNTLGHALQDMRRFGEAVTALQDAATVFRETGDRHDEAWTLNTLGHALQSERRYIEAITVYQNVAAIFQETGDRPGEAAALNSLGCALQEVRRFEEAIIALHDAVGICRETSDRHGEAAALNNLGCALGNMGRAQEAVIAQQEAAANYQNAAAIYGTTGDRHNESMALNNLGNALQNMRRFGEAITAHQAALAIYRETGSRHGEARTLHNLGLALQGFGRIGEAVTAYQDAAAIFRETGDSHNEDVALRNLDRARAADHN